MTNPLITNISRVKFKSYEPLNINHVTIYVEHVPSVFQSYSRYFWANPYIHMEFTSKYLSILSHFVVYPAW